MSIGKIDSVVTPGGTRLAVQWDDGRRAEIDLAGVIAGHAALAALADPDVFAGVQRAADGWSIEWPPCGIDFGAAQLRRWADEQAGETMPAADFRGWIERHEMTLEVAAAALGLSRRTIAYYLSGEQPVPKTVMLATEGFDARAAA
ncbi:DUF2442 domain-containing protein [Sphingomonas qilianensis]|uniref:DUF2442 domain-containing protein n=1 Tax=Sphingomonas qilianensis TaxID=1736690 RepID=A0ABU9XPR4_9SPHN